MIFLCKQNIEIKYGNRSADVSAYGAIKNISEEEEG